MPLYLKERNFLAVHAGFSPWCKLSENKEEDYFTVRTADSEQQKLSSKASGKGLQPWYEVFSDERDLIALWLLVIGRGRVLSTTKICGA